MWLVILLSVFCLPSLGRPYFPSPEKVLPWSCGESVWKTEPEVRDGVFHAEIKCLCALKKEPQLTLGLVKAIIEKEYRRQEKYTIHLGPHPIQQGELRGVKYELTDQVESGEGGLKIRQKVRLLGDEQEMKYETHSTQIQGTGSAAYLRKIDFSVGATLEGDNIVMTFINRVEVERPWFAVSFLFGPLSENITREKFATARDKLLSYFTGERRLH